MNYNDSLTFNRAVITANTGDKTTANAKLKTLLYANPNDANLLLWAAFTAPNLAEAGDLLDRASAIAPQSAELIQARQWLAQEKAKQAEQPFFPPFAVAPSPSQPPPVPIRSVQPYQSQPQQALTVPVVTKLDTYDELRSTPRSRRFSLPSKRTLLISLGLLGIIAVGVALYFVVFATKYVEYTSATNMIDSVKPGEHVKFAATLDLDGYNEPSGPVYFWSDTKQSPKVVVVEFDRSGELRASKGYATYYAVVDDKNGNNKYLYVKPEKVEMTTPTDVQPFYPVTTFKITQVMRTDYHPDLGESLKDFDKYWIVVGVEVHSPVANSQVDAQTIISDIKTTRLNLVSDNSNLSGAYKIYHQNLKSKVVGDEVVVTGQIVALGPPNWSTLTWSGSVGQRIVDIPLKLQ